MDALADTSVRGLDRLTSSLFSAGSLEPQKDLEAILAHDPIRNMLAEEAYRLLMEPIFRLQEEGWETAVTVFRPLRDMSSGEVYNWLLHFDCLDTDDDEFNDVALVLDPARHPSWRIYDFDLRGSRLFLSPNKEQLFQEGLSEDCPCAFEYVTVPKSLKPTDVIRTYYTSETVKSNDLVIAWGFPEREHHHG